MIPSIMGFPIASSILYPPRFLPSNEVFLVTKEELRRHGIGGVVGELVTVAATLVACSCIR